MKKVIRLTESDLVRIVKTILKEQKQEIDVDGNKIKATDKGNIQITSSNGKVYYYKMIVQGFETKVVNFGNDTITVIDPTPVFGGDELTKPFKKDSKTMTDIKKQMGNTQIVTTTNDGKKLVLKKV